ncbi:MAG: hypothetical protein KAJ98_02780 [Spirochaetaceae bacterium]|nr:hypothetical protein [Spirochaetaceae bacterium]
MISCDTNILLHAYNLHSNLNEMAMRFLSDKAEDRDFVICELVLIELYVLLRSPAVINKPLSGEKAVKVCQRYRENHNWRLIDYPGTLMTKIWERVSHPDESRRNIFDSRLAFTLRYHGVTDFATCNIKHFNNYEFDRVWNPLV